MNTPDLDPIRGRHGTAAKAVARLECIAFSDSGIARHLDRLVASWRDVAPLVEYLEQQPASAELVADVATYGPTPEDRAAAARSQAAEIATRLELALADATGGRPSGTSWTGFAVDVHAFLTGESATPAPTEPASAAGLVADVVQNATKLEKALAGMVAGGYALLEDNDGDPVLVLRSRRDDRLLPYPLNGSGYLGQSVGPKNLEYPVRLVVLREQGLVAAEGVA